MKMPKPKRATTRRGIERDDLGPLIHTALRKCCDSSESSLVYNVIHLCIGTENNGWGSYLDLAWAELDNANRPLWECAKRAGAALEYGNAERNALRLSMALMSQSDWEGAVAFLEPEE